MKEGFGAVATFLVVAVFLTALGIGGVFLWAKMERPLNDIHRQATECSLEYVNSTQATLQAQITQYNGFGPDTTEGQKRALISQMHAEINVIDTCSDNNNPVPPAIRSFINAHPVN